ncbi:MAG: hypothetical protein AB7K71_10955 [Polyangiaceae bacterium]
MRAGLSKRNASAKRLAMQCASALAALGMFSLSYDAAAQYPPQQYPPQQYPPQQYPPQQQPYPGQQPYGQPAPYGQPGYYPQPTVPRGKARSTDLEIGTLYGTSIAYGVGLGVWIDAEAGLSDPGLALIPPAILGVAAPVGVYFLDDPEMPRGMPSTIAAGMVIGAGEGIGIAGYQFVTADEQDAWGFKGLARSVSLGATLGAVGGYALAYYEEPSPKTAMFVSSGTVWGTAIGAMFGYGASNADQDYGQANDKAALGGLIGFNLGLAATAGLSAVYIPSWESLSWMWAGAGIGAAASLPVFLFYAGDGGPPAKRGLIFTGVATTLGLAAGAIFSSDPSDFGANEERATEYASASPSVSIDYVAPFADSGAFGMQVGGQIF